MDFYSTHQSKIGKKKGYTPVDTSGKPNTPSAHWKRLSIRTLGNILVIFALYMLTWVFYKPVIEEVKYAYNNLVGTQYVVAEELSDAQFRAAQGSSEKGLLSRALGGQRVEPLVPKDPNFSIVIPKLGANANVIANVSTSNDSEYLNALQRGVAHAAGTSFPGQGEHVYLFAHSTNTFSNVSRYNAVFYLLYKLEDGDEVNIYYEGVRHKYRVTGTKVVDPSEVQYLTRKTDGEFLTLQTCWPPGTIAKRMLVFAEPVVN